MSTNRLRAAEDRARSYGVQETNSLSDAGFESVGEWTDYLKRLEPEPMDWSDPQLEKIVRLRLLGDVGCPWWDVSYCMGVTKDGKDVRVRLPFDSLPRKNTRRAIIEHAKRDGVYANGLGILSAISTLV